MPTRTCFQSRVKKSLALEMLKSQSFDNFLATKFQSVKRYGGEGAEAMMGFFTELFDQAQQENIPDIVIAEVREIFPTSVELTIAN